MRIIASVVCLVLTVPLFADDIWIVQGYAQAATADPLYFTVWAGDALLFNTTDSVATIRLLETSNGAVPSNAVKSFDIQPHQAVTLNKMVGGAWQPTSFPPIWVDHLDVPTGVRVESRLELTELSLIGPPMVNPPMFGKLSFPVIRGLAPAGQQQLLLGADNSRTDSRINVGVYNGANTVAKAHIEIKRACDDAVVASDDFTVAANSLNQVSLQPPEDTIPCASGRASTWANYAVVTADEPSFTYVTTLLNHPLDNQPPVLRITAAVAAAQ